MNVSQAGSSRERTVSFEKVQQLHRSIMATLIRALEVFDAEKVAPEAFAANFFPSTPAAKTHLSFLTEVFVGISLYSPFLDAFSLSVLKRVASSPTLRNFSRVAGFLLFFSGGGAPQAELLFFLRCQEPLLVAAVLELLCDPQALADAAETWTDFETDWVEREVLRPVQSKRKILTRLLQKIGGSAAATAPPPPVINKRAATVPSPFQLSQPKRAVVAPPVQVVAPPPPRPPPDTAAAAARVAAAAEKRKQEAEKHRQALLASVKPFRFRLEKPAPSKETKDNVEEKTLSSQQTTANGLPHTRPSSEQLGRLLAIRDEWSRPTRAMAFRERQRAEAEEAAAAERAKQLEEQLRDSGEFQRWRQAEDQREAALRAEDFERRKAELEALVAEAARSRAQNAEEKQREALQQRQKGAKLLDQRRIEEQEELSRNRNAAARVRSAEAGVGLVKVKLEEERRVVADADKQKAKQRREEKERRDAELLAQRKAMIAEIKRIGEQNQSQVHPARTDAALESMSVSELRATLVRVRAEEAQRVAARREAILAESRRDAQGQAEALKMGGARRARRRAARQLARLERLAAEARDGEARAAAQRRRAAELLESIEAKKRMQKNLLFSEQKAHLDILARQAVFNQTAAQVEAKAIGSLFAAREREVTLAQQERFEIAQMEIETLKLERINREEFAEAEKRKADKRILESKRRHAEEIREAEELKENLENQLANTRSLIYKQYKKNLGSSLVSEDHEASSSIPNQSHHLPPIHPPSSPPHATIESTS